jgi:hypothetical protein
MIDPPIAFTSGEVDTYYAARVPDLKQGRAAERRGPCPIHNGKNDSFAVDRETGRWFCHSKCGRGGDILDLEAALNGGDFPTRKAEVLRLVGRMQPQYRHYGIGTNRTSAGIAPTKASNRGYCGHVAGNGTLSLSGPERKPSFRGYSIPEAGRDENLRSSPSKWNRGGGHHGCRTHRRS